MTLHFALQVNGNTIGTFEAQRMTEQTTPPNTEEHADAVHDYAIDIRETEGSRHTFVLSHRYGDGAFVLVQKAIGESLFAFSRR